jgi:hypothetical protein
MIRTRINYWGCSKFADWIRGEKKPFALEWGKWEEWRQEQKKKRPIRFWISDTLLNKVQNFILYPSDVWNEVKHYYDNRFVSKTHCLKTGLQPGKYHELDERIIHGLFNELVEFVECEQAWLNYISGDKKYKFKNGRCPEAGLDYLYWAISLRWDESSGFKKGDKEYGKPTPQSISAKKILDLYNWWKFERPNRKDPMEVSGWSDYYNNKDKYTKKQSSAMLNKLTKIEQQQDQEDEDMMIELIKIRKSLWT